MSLAAALQEDDLDAKLLALLDVWAACPDPALADLIDAVDRQLDQAPYPGSKAEQQRLFSEAAQHHALAELPRMLATLRLQSVGAYEILVARLLDAWPDDPRLTTFFRSMLEHPPYSSKKIRPAFNAFFQRMQTTADPRCAALQGVDLAPSFAGGSMGDYINRRRAATIDRRTIQNPRLDGPDTARVHHALAQLRGPDVVDLDTLRAAVFAAPEDDAPRQVYADALIEAGDLRGELIQLQLLPQRTPAQRTQVRTLLKRYAEAWLGPLHKLLVPGFQFERGFLAEATLRARSTIPIRAAVGDPRWRTVERITLDSGTDRHVLAIVQHRVCRDLKHLSGIRSDELVEVVEKLPNLRSLSLDSAPWMWDTAPPRGTAPLPRLQTLDVPTAAQEWIPWLVGERDVAVTVHESGNRW